MLTQIPEALNAWAEQTPLLGKGGVDAPSRKIPVPMKGADGVVRSNSKTISLERTTPSAPDSVASQHLFDGAATPPLPRRGLSKRGFLYPTLTRGATCYRRSAASQVMI